MQASWVSQRLVLSLLVLNDLDQLLPFFVFAIQLSLEIGDLFHVLYALVLEG